MYLTHKLFFHDRDSVHIFILVYVDDIIVTNRNSYHFSPNISTLQSKFALKDIGALRYLLGVEVTRSFVAFTCNNGNMSLTLLSVLAWQIVSLYFVLCCQQALIAYQVHFFHYPTLYYQIMGSLQYLSMTCPDTAFVINKAC